MKASNYIIYIHVPETGEYYLVHGYSGAVDRVGPEVMRFLLEHADPAHARFIKDQQIVRESLQGGKSDGISSDAFDLLKKRGYLTEMSSAEERLYVERLAGFLHKKKVDNAPPAFMFIPSYECNLRCPYCFEHDTRIELSKLKVLRNVMTEKMVDAAYKSMDMIVQERFGGRSEPPPQRDKITLYGGEPLMLENLPIIEYIVEKGIARGNVFGAITNGVDLHHYLHLLGPGKINFLQITLDGPKDLHDTKRIGPRHKDGTYDRIIHNMKMALQTGVRISVRYHVDFTNVARAKELADALKREDFGQYKNFSIYSYPVHMYHKGVEAPVFPQMALHQVHRQMETSSEASLAEQAQQAEGPQSDKPRQKVVKVSVPDDGIEGKLKVYTKRKLPGLFSANLEPCAATTGLYVFDPLGKIYNCWDTVGLRGQEIGTYSEEGPVLNAFHQSWLSRSPATIEECKDCKYFMFHFGGCASLPVSCKGTLFAPACYGFEDNFLYIAQKFFRKSAHTLSHKADVPVAINETPNQSEAGITGD
jgi:uncharacterized protein